LSRLSLPTTAATFLYGGFLGVLAASVLEPVFIRQLDFGSAFVIGLIEEFAKMLGWSPAVSWHCFLCSQYI